MCVVALECFPLEVVVTKFVAVVAHVADVAIVTEKIIGYKSKIFLLLARSG
jgi:hypothetical protein